MATVAVYQRESGIGAAAKVLRRLHNARFHRARIRASLSGRIAPGRPLNLFKEMFKFAEIILGKHEERPYPP